jgi:23S rRNA (uracil-5-)-methyltransferase RumA
MKKKKRRLFDALMEQYTTEPASPLCAHFPACGGCMFQHMRYEDQLALKTGYLNGIFEGILSVDEVAPAEPFGYRTRMDFVCAFGKIGLRERGFYKFVVDIQSCPLQPERADDLMSEIRPMLLDVEGYDFLKHSGYLRYLVLRQAGGTGQLMANLIVSRPENTIDKLLEKMAAKADSVSLLVCESLADINFGDEFVRIKSGYIEENFDGIKFRITPNSFFQSNSAIALKVYRKIKDMVRGRTLDLYSGVGSISLYAAAAADSMTGVELVSEAVDTAHINREINSAENVNFICADSLDYLKSLNEKIDTLILDPPRSGMHPKMLKEISRVMPERIVYMSCNPAVFRTELEAFEGYNLKSFEAFDMFPQTPHVESLALFEKK